MIIVSHISKSFGSVCAVDDLSFSIKPGEIVGFLGPNGAGKTTTMRLLTGFLTPDRGSVVINSTNVEEDPISAQKQIGYLPENNPLYKDMLVSEFLEFSARLKQIPQQQLKAAFDFVVSAVDIADVFYRPVGELSKGYKQRVGLAVALLHQPKIIIMDEPSEGLDPNQRTEIRALIKKLAKNHTIIMSTHVMQEAQAVCDRLLIISHGTLVADGTPTSLANKARHGKTIIVELEGTDVLKKLQEIKKVTLSDVKKLKGDHLRAHVSGEKNEELQPILSQLINKHKWIVWKLAEEEHTLEDIFHDLTSE